MTSSAGLSRTQGDAPRGRRSVFVDAAILVVSEPAADRRHEGRRVLAPGAADAIQLLLEAHDVVVIADAPLDDVQDLASIDRARILPTGFSTGSWYITSDFTWCEGDRPAGLRTILVGPRRPPARRPTVRCDTEARDLSAAVMEILVRETMA